MKPITQLDQALLVSAAGHYPTRGVVWRPHNATEQTTIEDRSGATGNLVRDPLLKIIRPLYVCIARERGSKTWNL